MNNINLDFKSLSATQLRTVLLVCIVLIVCGQIGLIVVGQRFIQSFSQPVAESVTDSASSQQTLQDLEAARVTLEKQKDTVAKSSLLTADTSNTYLYQTRIIQDITNYASRAGLSPTSFTFAGEGGEGAGVSPSPSPAAADAPAAGGVPGAPGASSPTVSVTVSFSDDITYDSFFRFLRLLEGSLLRMEIDGLNLSRPATPSGEGQEGTPAGIGISSLNIKVHTR